MKHAFAMMLSNTYKAGQLQYKYLYTRYRVDQVTVGSVDELLKATEVHK